MTGPTFLVPLDGTEATERALRRAARTVQPLPGARIRLLAVIDAGFQDMPDEVLEGLNLDPSLHEVHPGVREARAMLDRATRIVDELRVPQERRIRRGKPYDVILEESRLADVLVLHHLAPHRWAERIGGSMTERIARHAACHVLLMRSDPTPSARARATAGATRPR